MQKVLGEKEMTIIFHTDFAQRSGMWDKIRCGKLTASCLSKVLTPGRLQLSAQAKDHALVVAAQRIKGCADASFSSMDMERGEELEEEARHVYSMKYSPVEEIGFAENTALKFQFGASPDGMVNGRKKAIEIKAPQSKGHMQTLIYDNIDGEYMLQMQGTMLATGAECTDFVSYHEGLIMRPILVERDEKIISRIIEAGEEFEAMVQKILTRYAELAASPGVVAIAMPEEIV